MSRNELVSSTRYPCGAALSDPQPAARRATAGRFEPVPGAAAGTGEPSTGTARSARTQTGLPPRHGTAGVPSILATGDAERSA